MFPEPGPPQPDVSALMAQQPDQEGPDPLSALQDAIHAVAAAMGALPDPQDTQDAAQAMLTLSKIQTRLMNQAAPGAPQAG